MSKISKAIYEIEHISQMANKKDQWMNRIHPLVKLFITMLYITVTVSFHKYDVAGVLAMSIYPIVLFGTMDISLRESLHRLRIVLPIVCIVGIFNPLFDREIVAHLAVGSLPDGGVRMIEISGGLLSMVSLMIKGVLTVLASYFLIVTTTIEDICYSLRLLHVPKVVVTQIMLIYRYITLLLKEAQRITQAYSLRAPGQKGIHFSAWGSLVGQMLLRSMDRADEVYASMCLRGYSGEFPNEEKRGFHWGDGIFLLIGGIAMLVCRVVPIFTMVGGLFL